MAHLNNPIRFRPRQLPRPPPSPPPALPSPSQHQAACTHLTVTRLYGPCVRCQVCYRTPRIGWVYACTQDHGGILPEVGIFAPCTAAEPDVPISQDLASITLSPWIKKAIDDGCYNEQQIEHLKAQKQGVRDAIARAEGDLANSSTSSEQSFQSSHSTPIKPDITSENENDTELGSTPLTRNFDGMSDSRPRIVQRVSPVCHARVCHNCRTTYRERALLSLDSILESASTTVPESELDNRPVSDVNVINGMMFRRLRREKRTIADKETLPPAGHKYTSSSCEEMGMLDGMDYSQASRSSDTGEMAGDEHYPTVLDTITEEGGDESTGLLESDMQVTQPMQSMSLYWHRPQTQYVRDGNGQQSNLGIENKRSVLEEGAEGSECSEVEVEHGVAVKEEGISNHTPDIITQF